MSPTFPRPVPSLSRRRRAALALAALAGILSAPVLAQEPARQPPVKVTIKDEKPVVVEPVLPLDPRSAINYGSTGVGAQVRAENNQTLHLSHFPTFQVDGQRFEQMQPGLGGRQLYVNKPLPQDKTGKHGTGFVSAYKYGDLEITVTVRLTPTYPPKGAAKRRLDAVLIHYAVENKGQKAHKFGLRAYMDTYVIDNDGCIFASPSTEPGKLLDGMTLKGKKLPPYLQMLQRPNLKAPGYVSHLTLDLGNRLERPDKLLLTRYGFGFNSWDMPVMASMGDSAIGLYWEPKEIRPGGKREYAYAYGKGQAINLEGNGQVELAVDGSFEPGKAFKVLARVSDPAVGQVLSLELPEGMALLEGKELQPVPPPLGDDPQSLVVWRARVLRPGDYAVRVRSSTGVTQGKLISIAR
jgi:hypothetical protein